MTTRKTILTGLSALIALSGAANAADYGAIYGGLLQSAPELVPVEIGTGWYLRVDGSYDFEQDFDGTFARSDPAFGEPVAFDELRLDDGFGLGGGFGYQFTEYLRGDATARYSKLDVAGFGAIGCSGFIPASDCLTAEWDGGDATSWELMANAYVDLGTFAGFTPYVGGGVGALKLDYEDGSFSCGLDCSTSASGQDNWRFAYALAAGVAYDVNRSLTVDVGYRYLNVEGGDSYDMSAVSDATTNDFRVEDDGFDRHTIMAGIRYSLW